MSSRGISRIGNSEVAGIGIASVDHQTAISAARPTVSQAFSERPPVGRSDAGQQQQWAQDQADPRGSTAPRL